MVPHRIIRSCYTGHLRVGCYIWYSEEISGRGSSVPWLLFAVQQPIRQRPVYTNHRIAVIVCCSAVVMRPLKKLKGEQLLKLCAANYVLQVGLPDLPYFPGAPVFRPLSPVSRTEAKISRI